MDKAAVRRALDQCLLTDAEMGTGIAGVTSFSL